MLIRVGRPIHANPGSSPVTGLDVFTWGGVDARGGAELLPLDRNANAAELPYVLAQLTAMQMRQNSHIIYPLCSLSTGLASW
jgi:hypothetical protein